MSYDSNEVLDDCGTSSVSNDYSSCDITEYMWTRSLNSVKITREGEREGGKEGKREREGKYKERKRVRSTMHKKLCNLQFLLASHFAGRKNTQTTPKTTPTLADEGRR